MAKFNLGDLIRRRNRETVVKVIRIERSKSASGSIREYYDLEVVQSKVYKPGRVLNRHAVSQIDSTHETVDPNSLTQNVPYGIGPIVFDFETEGLEPKKREEFKVGQR